MAKTTTRKADLWGLFWVGAAIVAALALGRIVFWLSVG